MADPLVVILFLASGARLDSAGSTMTSTAQRALGPGAVVLVELRTELPTFEVAESMGDRQRAYAVIEVAWDDEAHTHATLRAHLAGQAGWVARDITFLPADPPEERGRTLGFAMASLIDGDSRLHDSPPSLASQTARDDDGPRSRLMVDVAGVGTVGGGPGTTAAGGELVAMFLVHPRFAAAVSASVRVASVSGADSTLLSVPIGAGAVWRALVLPARRSFELDLRVDVLGTFLHASRQGATQSSWQPGGRLTIEPVWFAVSPGVGLIAVGGVEAAFGSAAVVVGSHTVASVSPVRAVGELGLRARF